MDRIHRGVRVLATPSTCIQFLPDSDDFALDQVTPGWRYLELTATGDIITQVERLEGDVFQPTFDSAGY